MNWTSDQTPDPTLPGPLLPQASSYQKLGDGASRAHGGAVQAEGWGGCQGGRENAPSEGQRSGDRPAGEQGLLNLEKGAEAQGSGAAPPPGWY